jgi:membrane protein required for colicin V production
MNFIDILFLIIIAYFSYKGFKNGFIIEIFTLLAFLVGIYAGINFSDGTASFMKENWGFTSDYLPVIAFTISFLAAGAMVFFGGKFLEKVVDVTGLSIANKLGGVGFALIKSLYFLSVLTVLLEAYDEKNDFISEQTKSKSLLYNPVKEIAVTTIPQLKESSIFLRNSLLIEADSSGLSVDDIIRTKEVADSLGIELNDVKRLKEFHDSIVKIRVGK